MFHISSRTVGEIKVRNVSAAGGVHMQNCMSETAKTFTAVLAFSYFNCATAEIKHRFAAI